jgi:hypothetical protein
VQFLHFRAQRLEILCALCVSRQCGCGKDERSRRVRRVCFGIMGPPFPGVGLVVGMLQQRTRVNGSRCFPSNTCWKSWHKCRRP